jgi:murein L,D-transpeptidase YafK
MTSFQRLRFIVLGLALTALGGCIDEQTSSTRHLQPLSYATVRQLEEKGMHKQDPILIRIYKEESELEVWKPAGNGRYALFKTYDICKWSGNLGPKIKEGDRQAPEGFYTVTPAQMNPNSSYYLSFNIGFPNSYDRSLGRTGQHLMVHGACSSAGCYAMTDETIAEIYALARDAFRGGQREFQVQAYPFHMTPQNMARHAGDPNMSFWKKLKEGSDHFEVTGLPPKVGVCGREYVFNANPVEPNKRLDPYATCPRLDVPNNIEAAVAAKEMRDETAYQVALAEIKQQEQQQLAAQTVMVAQSQDQGSAEGYSSEAEVDQVLGTEVAETEAAKPDGADAEAAPADFAAATAEPQVQGGLPAVATAFTGVWGKLVNITGLRSLDEPVAAETNAMPETPTDPITTGTVPASTPASAAGATPGKSAAASDAVPAGAVSGMASVTAFLPVFENDDPFAVFDFFEDVNGVSVPADMVRR